MPPLTITISQRKRIQAILTYAFLMLLAVYSLVPFIWMLSTSLKTEAEAFAIPPTWIPRNLTFDAYVGIWVRKPFAIFFFNSAVVSFSTALFSTLIGAVAGYGFSRFRFRGRETLIGIFLATQMLPGGLLVGPYFKMLSKVGLFNTRLGLIIALTTICLPFCTWMLKGFVDTVSTELDDAALVDGCSRFRAFWRIILPIVRPGMVATLLFGFLLAWGDLLWALCLTSTDRTSTVTLGIAHMVGEFRIIWPMLMSGSILGALPGLVFYLALQSFLVRGLTAGAVKE